METEQTQAEFSIGSTLANANFLRMRGQFEEAEQNCLKVLEYSPDNADALSLLGDIAAEQGSLESSLHWYGLALETYPDSAGIRLKRDRIQLRLKEKESNDAALVSTRFTKRWPAWMIVLQVVCVLIILASIAFEAGKSNSSSHTLVSDPIVAPVTVPKAQTTTLVTAQTQPESKAKSSTVTQSTQNQVIPSPHDPNLAGLFNINRPEITLISYSNYDPRVNSALIEAVPQAGTDLSGFANQLAIDLFTACPQIDTVTIRLTQSGQTVFIADSTRKLFESMPATNSASTTSSANTILTSIWQAGSNSKATDGSNGSNVSTASP